MKIKRYIINFLPKEDNKEQKEKTISRIVNESISKEVQRIWSERIETALKSQYTFRIKEIPGIKSEILNFCDLANTANNQELIDLNERICSKLEKLQNEDQRTSDGYLILFTGITIVNKKFVCLLKLEESEALGTSEEMIMIALNNILMTSNTKIFKLFLFLDNNTSIEYYAMDDQSKKNKLSDFWLSKFFECTYYENPEIMTMHFLAFVYNFADKTYSDPKDTENIKNSLIAYLNSDEKLISYKNFAKIIPKDYKNSFEEEYRKTKQYDRQFKKVINKKVLGKIEKRKYLLEGDIIVVIPEILFTENRLVSINTEISPAIFNLRAKIEKRIY